jgi:hypothetical protein
MSEKLSKEKKKEMLDAICGPEAEYQGGWDENLLDAIEFSIYTIRAEVHTLEKLFWRLKQDAK